MRNTSISLAIISSMINASVHATVLNLYVDINGNDNWNGKSISYSDTSSGPFATIYRAQKEIRDLKRNNLLPKDGVIITISDGKFRLDKELTFTNLDSGTAQGPIIYKAGNIGQTILSGSSSINKPSPISENFTLTSLQKENILISKLSETQAKSIENTSMPCKWPCLESKNRSELFYDGKRMHLARWPNKTDFDNTSYMLSIKNNSANPSIITPTNSFSKNYRFQHWSNESNAWLYGFWYWDWADQHLKLEHIDTKKNIFLVEKPGHRFGYKKGNPFYAYNILSELDEPFEWYYDHKKKYLYYWPGENTQSHIPELSIINSAIVLNNTSYIRFDGITIENVRGTAIHTINGNSIQIHNCIIRNTGSWGIQIKGSTNSLINNCDITETGLGGIYINAGNRSQLIPSNNIIVNNNIHNYGKWIKTYQPGILLNGVGITVANNDIHNAPHQAIWLKGNNHIIRNNKIHNVCKQSNDAGAIYAGADWTMRGTVIKHNYFHNIIGLNKSSASAIYLDDMFSGTIITGNLFDKVIRPVIIGGGRDNIIKNNIFINATNPISLDDRGLNSMQGAVHSGLKYTLGLVPYKSKIWSQAYPKLVPIWEDNPGAPKGNMIINNINIGTRWLAIRENAKKYVSTSKNYLNADPNIIDTTNLKFTISKESFRNTYNFEHLPLEDIGRKLQ